MLPAILVGAGIVYAAKLALDYYASSVRDDERAKRTRVRQHTFAALRNSERDARGKMLDMLSAAQDEAWAEIGLIRNQRSKMRDQLRTTREIAAAARDFAARSQGRSLVASLHAAVAVLDAHEHYWHLLVAKYSKKKNVILSAPLSEMQRLGVRYFERQALDEFLKVVPIRGQACLGRVAGWGAETVRLSFDGNIKARLSRDDIRAAKVGPWREDVHVGVVIKQVNYRDGSAEVDLGRTALYRLVEKHGLDQLVLESRGMPVEKDGRTVGHTLDWRGVRVFLPASRAQGLDPAQQPVRFKLQTEAFDPFNLVAVPVAKDGVEAVAG